MVIQGDGHDNHFTSFGDRIDVEVLTDVVKNAFPDLRAHSAPLDLFLTLVAATHGPEHGRSISLQE
jgi:hypothetical protein